MKLKKTFLLFFLLSFSSIVFANAPAFLGISFKVITGLKTISADLPDSALQIMEVLENSPAMYAHLQRGDLILAYDSVEFSQNTTANFDNEFRNYIAQKALGSTLTLKIARVLESVESTPPMLFEDFEQVKKTIDNLELNQNLQFKLQKTLKIFTQEIVLTARPQPVFFKTPTNAQLFPAFELLKSLESELTEPLLKQTPLAIAYQDVLQRQIQDESADTWHLSLVRYLRRDPLKLPAVTRIVSNSLLQSAQQFDLTVLLQKSSVWLDEVPLNSFEKIPAISNFEQYLLQFNQQFEQALQHRARAFRSLTPVQQQLIEQQLPELLNFLTTFNIKTPNDLKRYSELIRVLHLIDFTELFRAAEVLAPLTQSDYLASLKQAALNLPPNPTLAVEGVAGNLRYVGNSLAGLVIVGDIEANQYNINAALMIDLGGDDSYFGKTGVNHPQIAATEGAIQLLIDFQGNDEYSATEDFTQGSSLFGLSFLVDLQGNDHYTALQFAQGVGIVGVGVLADFSGDDRYQVQKYGQAVGMMGIGILLENAGNDRYQAQLYAQGVGMPKGLGGLIESAGDDDYFASGGMLSSYGTSGVFHAASQAYGMGWRDFSPPVTGGLGILIDGQGRDTLRAGNFSQGGGYFFALGILHNAGNEDDSYYASRYGQGFAAHSAVGVLLEDGGNDNYAGLQGALQAAAWDLSLAGLFDSAGNDSYLTPVQFFSQASAAHNSFAWRVDNAGRDIYQWSADSKIPSNEYHGGQSFAIQIDIGQQNDQYPKIDYNNQQQNLQEFAIILDK